MRILLLLMKVLAPLYFHIADFAFRSGLFQSAPQKHQWIMKLYRLAADTGHGRALSVYGHLLHLRGDSIASKIQGAIYLERAAEKGDMKAQYQLGRIYEHGFEHYFRPSAARALAYYRLAAEQGHVLAISRLIEVFENGELEQQPDPPLVEQWRKKLPGA